MQDDDPHLLVDDALIRLRRLWTGPAPRPATADRNTPVEMSTVLVIDAIHRLRATQPNDSEVTVAAIAARLDVAASTASRIVDRAVTASMVTRRASAVDARRVTLSLTPHGEALFVEASTFRRSYLAQVLQGWTVVEVDTFAELLDRFASAVHEHPLPGPPEERRATGAAGT